ncbi:MAG: hypothetical protein PHG99_03110 [Erysipelotrichaceae bacterium]|nr:hypothetical protein [Erysipelotrichaceae bacterium]MDD4642474.1 hypothetical protein [Erysipelotrichaceae bacterium]
MLKWFVDLFFETEEVIVEEHDEKIQPKPTTPKDSQSMLDKTSSVKQESKPTESEEKVEGIIIKEPTKEEKRSIFINESTDSETNKDEIIKEIIKEEFKVFDDDYQFTPIISPIFGVDEKHQPQKAKKTTIKPIIDNTSAIGTIISPIYGLEIQRSPFFIRSKELTTNDPDINIDLQQMVIEEGSTTSMTEMNLESDDQEEMETFIEESEVIDHGEQTNIDLGVNDKNEIKNSKNEKKDVSEEEKFLEDQQPSLFDYLR